MQILLDVALPVFAIILCGYAVGRAGLLGDHATEALNKFVYWVALPPLLFKSMAEISPREIFVWEFIIPYLLVMLVVFFGAIILIMGVVKRSFAEASLAGMTGIFGNTGYMGIPLVTTAFGVEAILPAIIATVINSAVIVGAIAALLEISLNRGRSPVAIVGQVMVALAKNPLVVSSVLGIAWSFLALPLPVSLATFADIVGGAAGPCALFAIGLFLVGKPVSEGLDEVSFLVALKLIAMPMIAYQLLHFVPDLDVLWQKVFLIMCALPIGANVFVLALRYETYVLPASSATLLSTVLSVITISGLLVVLGV